MQQDSNVRYVSTNQIFNGDIQKITNKLTVDSSQNVTPQTCIEHTSLPPEVNTKSVEMHSFDDRNTTATVGPDSTCLEIGNSTQEK